MLQCNLGNFQEEDMKQIVYTAASRSHPSHVMLSSTQNRYITPKAKHLFSQSKKKSYHPKSLKETTKSNHENPHSVTVPLQPKTVAKREIERSWCGEL